MGTTLGTIAAGGEASLGGPAANLCSQTLRILTAYMPTSRCLARCAQVLVAQKVTTGVYKGVTTSELDELAAETAASLTATHPDYALVSSTLAKAGGRGGQVGW